MTQLTSRDLNLVHASDTQARLQIITLAVAARLNDLEHGQNELPGWTRVPGEQILYAWRELRRHDPDGPYALPGRGGAYHYLYLGGELRKLITGQQWILRARAAKREQLPAPPEGEQILAQHDVMVYTVQARRGKGLGRRGRRFVVYVKNEAVKKSVTGRAIGENARMVLQFLRALDFRPRAEFLHSPADVAQVDRAHARARSRRHAKILERLRSKPIEVLRELARLRYAVDQQIGREEQAERRRVSWRMARSDMTPERESALAEWQRSGLLSVRADAPGTLVIAVALRKLREILSVRGALEFLDDAFDVHGATLARSFSPR